MTPDEQNTPGIDPKSSGPPYRKWSHEKWENDPPEWVKKHRGPSDLNRTWDARQKRLAQRFGCLFLTVAVSFLGLMVGLVLFVWQVSTSDNGNPAVLLWVICGVPIALFLPIAFAARTFFTRLARPVSDIMAAADDIGDGDLSVRVNEDVPGPVGRLAVRFNRMTAELERSEQQRRNLTADVAHELRTPLHIVQGNLEGVLDGVYDPTNEHITATLDEVHTLSRLVNDLQLLSLAEAGQLTLHRRPESAADLLADVVTRFTPQATELGVTLEVAAADESLMVNADADRLDQVLTNLVANALRHTPEDGRISLAAEADGEMVRLTVADTGTGIPPEDLPYIFDCFGVATGRVLATATPVAGWVWQLPVSWFWLTAGRFRPTARRVWERRLR
ncbi:MAG: ATP-binding protein [Chloroflexota bacterium]